MTRAKQIEYLAKKRAIDIVCSCLGIFMALPLLLVVALLIKIEDLKGSIFYKQKRVGKDGSTFNMYKFRSMVTDAESKLDSILHLNEASGNMFKVKNDPRITKVGRVIRKTSIDELPQLWNVLKGEMSLVGPRPPLPREVENYSEHDSMRLTVIPGCTGLWQVSGRNELGFKEMVELDLQYINERTVLFDIKIIVRTIFVLLGSKAY